MLRPCAVPTCERCPPVSRFARCQYICHPERSEGSGSVPTDRGEAGQIPRTLGVTDEAQDDYRRAYRAPLPFATANEATQEHESRCSCRSERGSVPHARGLWPCHLIPHCVRDDKVRAGDHATVLSCAHVSPIWWPGVIGALPPAQSSYPPLGQPAPHRKCRNTLSLAPTLVRVLGSPPRAGEGLGERFFPPGHHPPQGGSI
jgi:hypothetical protein